MMLARNARTVGAGLRQTWRAASSSGVRHQHTHVDEDIYNRQRSVFPMGPRVPSIANDAWVAPNAVVIGDVDIVDGASIMYGAVVRGDLNHIRIGPYTCIGERSIIHAARAAPTGLTAATVIGANVTVGAGSILRSTTVGDNVMVGQKCILMEGSVVETNSMLEAGTVLPPGRMIPSGQVWGGNPAAYKRELTADEVKEITTIAKKNGQTKEEHSSEFLPYSFSYVEAEKVRVMQAK